MDLTASVISNRRRLTEKMDKGSVAVIHSNDTMPTNSDCTYRFRQNNDLYWLTGIRQEDTTLLLFPDHPDPSFQEILFVKYVDEQFVKWHGRRLSLEEASNLSGIKNVKWQSQFASVFYTSAVYAENIYLNTIEHPRSINEVQTRDDRFIKWCLDKFPLHHYKRLAPIFAQLRITKSEYEIEQIRKACFITEQGFRRLLRFVKPGVKEKLIQAELIHEYMQHGGEWAEYEPIIASGENTCILHYNSNHNICRDGDLLLVDAAASYDLYNTDLTRVIPVSGRFTSRQKQLYNAVLKVHNSIKQFIRAGLLIREIQDYTNELLIEQFMALKLCSPDDIKQKGKKYFLEKYCNHNFGHLLGLDVHDAGNIYEKLPVNSILTVEPGIYIESEKIGVRIENNVQLTEQGIIDLMVTIPIEAEEIEEIMNK